MAKKKILLPLMEDNITTDDLKEVTKLIKKKPILTQSKKVLEFEKKWSKWLGVKYSIFVNSGSSANLLSILALKIFRKLNTKGEIIVPSLTWISDIVAVINNNLKPVFVDINLDNLSMNEEEIYKKITKNTKAVFITHAQGFNGLSNKLLNFLKKKKIDLIEDVCESHGAKFKNKKLGTFGIISNFSFYYAHHLSTIEGGMICTNNKEIYKISRMLRSHGMLRESGDKNYEKKIINKYSMLSPKFIFMYPGFNMRNNEISAVIGINQLKKLNRNNIKRNRNLKYFLKKLNGNTFYKNFNMEGISNYAFPLILNKKYKHLRDKLEKKMKLNGIEFRRGNAGGGNQLRQPYLKKYTKKINLKKFPNVDHVHFYGYYIGNFPTLSFKTIDKVLNTINLIDTN